MIALSARNENRPPPIANCKRLPSFVKLAEFECVGTQPGIIARNENKGKRFVLPREFSAIRAGP
jgi:hypothetical protein